MKSTSNCSRNNVFLLKLRPTRSSPGDLTKSLWKRILDDHGLELAEEAFAVQEFLSDTEPHRQQYETDLLRTIHGCGDFQTLIIDACFDPTFRELYPCHECLANVLSRLAHEDDLGNLRIFVLTSLRAKDSSQIFGMADPKIGALRSNLLVLGGNGQITGTPLESREKELLNALYPYLKQDGNRVLFAHFKSNLLRQRGVFEVKENKDHFYRFRYILDERAFKSVCKLIQQLIENERPEIRTIVVDVSSSFWMRSLAASLQGYLINGTKVIVYDGKPINTRVVKRVRRAERNVMLLSGVTRAGGFARRLCKKFELERCDDYLSVALLCHDANANVGALPGELDNAIWQMRTFAEGVTCHYLLGVEVGQYGSEDWQVKAASSLEEIQDLGEDPTGSFDNQRNAVLPFERSIVPKDARHRPLLPEIGLWDLLVELGVGKETLGGALFTWDRNPVRYMPGGSKVRLASDVAADRNNERCDVLYAKMADFDANWLAEVMINEFLWVTQRSDREELVVVVPKEDSGLGVGAARILEAMIRHRGVKALRLDRKQIASENAVLEGHDAECAAFWSASEFVIFDEATVRRRVLRSVQRFLKASDVRARVAGVVFDVSTDVSKDCELELFSLGRWRHFAEASDE